MLNCCHFRTRVWLFALGVPLSILGGARPGAGEEMRTVTREEIAQAMRESRGYDLTATANGPRLQAEVLVRLIRDAQARDPERRPLLLGHREWFEAFLERTGLTESSAPLYARLSYQIGQDVQIDYRREKVIEAVVQGPEPTVVANVRVCWPSAPGAPSSYSYEDVLSQPHLRVTQKRLITYRLVVYPDRVWYAEVHGLRGRPTSGALGVLFDLIGEVPLRESRMAVSSDGLQISRGFGRKGPIGATATVTVYPNGRAEKGLPPNRPDLVAIEQRLRVSLKLSYVPLPPPARQPTAGLP